MSTLSIQFKRLSPHAQVPLRASAQSAGFDLTSTQGYLLHPGERHAVSTGLALSLPEGFEAQIRPRSGLALNHGVTVINAPGTIDADFRGEIKVLCINMGQEVFQITPGMRIAQLVVAPVPVVTFQEVETLSETLRGESGFGSTGL